MGPFLALPGRQLVGRGANRGTSSGVRLFGSSSVYVCHVDVSRSANASWRAPPYWAVFSTVAGASGTFTVGLPRAEVNGVAVERPAVELSRKTESVRIPAAADVTLPAHANEIPRETESRLS